MKLIKYNWHWDKGLKYPYEKYRIMFNGLIDELKSRQVVEVSGLRRTGKTTLLLQVLNYLAKTPRRPKDTKKKIFGYKKRQA